MSIDVINAEENSANYFSTQKRSLRSDANTATAGT